MMNVLLLPFFEAHGQSIIGLLPDSSLANLEAKRKLNLGYVQFTYKIDDNTSAEISLSDTVILSSSICYGIQNKICVHYNNDKVKKINQSINGCQDGISVEFYKSGTIKCYGNTVCLNQDTVISTRKDVFDTLLLVTNEIVVTENFYSVADGKWFYYLQDGILEKIVVYDKGKVIESHILNHHLQEKK